MYLLNVTIPFSCYCKKVFRSLFQQEKGFLLFQKYDWLYLFGLTNCKWFFHFFLRDDDQLLWNSLPENFLEWRAYDLHPHAHLKGIDIRTSWKMKLIKWKTSNYLTKKWLERQTEKSLYKVSFGVPRKLFSKKIRKQKIWRRGWPFLKFSAETRKTSKLHSGIFLPFT